MSEDLRNLAGWLVWGALAAVAWVLDVVVGDEGDW